MTARTALVTGGGGGIGAAICRGLADAGHRVAVADLAVERARQVAADIDGVAVELDVTDPASVAAAVAGAAEAFGPIEICVSCAGWDELRPFLDTDEAFQAKVIEINLAGPMRVTRAVLPAMVERSFGRIVNILRRRRVRLVARVGVLRSQGWGHRVHQDHRP